MNDQGTALAWLAVQVAILLVPALAWHRLASRRGPASGAWSATASLALVVGLSVVVVCPGREAGRFESRPSLEPYPAASAAKAQMPGGDEGTSGEPAGSPGGWIAAFRLAWDRLEAGASEPVTRCRPWGSWLAAVVLGAMGVSLARLALGLVAVEVGRARSRPVDDPEMLAGLEDLRRAMEIRAVVSLREADDLGTAAVAGWRRPVILLPIGWRSWLIDERRAVLAHELAHVARGDYASGLLARLALALHPFHPLVRRLAGELWVQQEQAADALAARFAGGRGCYLAALSRLALMQDGRSPRWAARGFLAGRGTLIRRIAMLREQAVAREFDGPSSRGRLAASALPLVVLAVAVASLRGPARGGDAGPPARLSIDAPVTPAYLDAGKVGLVAVRPSALFGRPGMKPFGALLEAGTRAMLGQMLKERPGAKGGGVLADGPRLRLAEIEWATFALQFGTSRDIDGKILHSFMIDGTTVRMAAPFDWPAFLRRWGFDLAEVHEGEMTYQRLDGPLKPAFGAMPCLMVLDDRTVVIDEELHIQRAIRGESPVPAYLRSPEWQRAGRGLAAITIGNRDGTFARQYDLGRPDDKRVLSAFQGVDQWTLSLDDADELSVRATAILHDGTSGEPVAKAVEAEVAEARAAVGRSTPTEGEHHARGAAMAARFLEGLRVERSGGTIELVARGFGSLVDLAGLIAAASAEQDAAPEPTR